MSTGFFITKWKKYGKSIDITNVEKRPDLIAKVNNQYVIGEANYHSYQRLREVLSVAKPF